MPTRTTVYRSITSNLTSVFIYVITIIFYWLCRKAEASLSFPKDGTRPTEFLVIDLIKLALLARKGVFLVALVDWDRP